jgi:hypothetical protein
MSLRRAGVGAAWALAVWLGSGGAAAADAYRVSAFITPDHDITETQTIRLVLQVVGDGNARLTQPRLDGLRNLRVVGGPESRFNSVWNNGRFSSTSQLVYTLLPEGPGPAEVPALRLAVDGRDHTTDPIRFEVARAPAGVPPPRRGGAEPSRPEAAGDRADVFVRAKLSKDSVWLGEPVELSVLLYTAERIANPGIASQPSLAQFWVEEIEHDVEAEAYRETVEGQAYIVYPLVRRVLVPQITGRTDIDPFVLQIPVRLRGGGDPFDFFSFGRTQTVVRKTQALALQVRPLPTDGRPAEFSGAVGSFKLGVKLDRDEAQVNDAVALSATVEGEGFLRAVEPPRFAAPADLKVFDPKVSASARGAAGKLVSRKTWEWVLVPLSAGDKRVGEVRFGYFDPSSGRYEVASGAVPDLVVRRGASSDEPQVAQGDIRLERRDLVFIKPLDGELSRDTPRAHHRGGYLALLVLPLLWVPLAVALGRHRARLQRDHGFSRARRARARARRRLRAAGRRLAATDAAAFHEEVARALIEFVADRFNRSAAGLTYDATDELLTSRGVDPALRRRLRTCLETCDFARFVPASGASERRGEVLEEATRLMDQLEKAC